MFNTTIAKVAAFAAAGLTLGGLGVVGSNALAAPTPIATPTFAAPAAVLDANWTADQVDDILAGRSPVSRAILATGLKNVSQV